MRECEYAEFTNRHGDDVIIRLSQDSFEGFHLIVKCKMVRRREETRVMDGLPVKIPVGVFTDETKHIQLPDARTAAVEYRLECVMHNMPGFGTEEFMEWQKATEKEGA